MMREPPAEPVAMSRSPVSMSSAMEEAMEDVGRLPGLMKFVSEWMTAGQACHSPNEVDRARSETEGVGEAR